MSATNAKPSKKDEGKAAWLSVGERGGVLGIRFVVFLCTAFGRPLARAFIAFLAAWYFLFDGHARRSSRAFLERVHDRLVTRWMVYRHILTFARVTLDRLFFAAGKTSPFRVEFHGEEFLEALRTEHRGALLILAHVGSFEAARALASERQFAIHILGNFHNARLLNEALARMNPAQSDTHLIDIGAPGSIEFVFKAEQRIAEGELVATMGDRVGPDGKHLSVDFLGARAPFPTGPYLLAAALGCPVYLAFGLYSEPNRYDLYCEPFAEKISLDRRDREGSVRPYVEKYSERLEHYARQAPFDWFNFYDFWGK
ncbi:MAG: hypothetical protein LBM75_07565 [Myxococcales bacterium]|jgi:predicted LPLAT superfamily acyltransferase|nr:hypothetical protein [Myxococcales bacterium]